MVYPIIVMPVLNEAPLLLGACRSLGFDTGHPKPEASIIVVDNGSTDGTRRIAAELASRSAAGNFLVVEELRKGHVAARNIGIRHAEAHAEQLGVRPEDVLIIQADGDTIYEPGYVLAMAEAAARCGRGALLEGVSIPPVADECAGFHELEAAVDAEFDPFGHEPDVIVDDKVAAYMLADYADWGGHRHEFSSRFPQDEILAETTRLYIRALLLSGARRIHVPEAEATTSNRRILEWPSLAFATAGFPRGAGWREAFKGAYRGAEALHAFRPEAPRQPIADAVRMRGEHLAGMFRVLPALVAEARLTRCDAQPGFLLEEALRLAGAEAMVEEGA